MTTLVTRGTLSSADDNQIKIIFFWMQHFTPEFGHCTFIILIIDN
jgi:hypothetical protein